MDGLGRHYAKCNKSDRERQILYDITYAESKKYNKLVNITKKKQTHRYREQVVITSEGEGQYRGGEWEAQSIGCKTGLRMYSITQGILSIFFNNCKWKVIFKIVEFFKIKNL